MFAEGPDDVSDQSSVAFFATFEVLGVAFLATLALGCGVGSTFTVGSLAALWTAVRGS